MSGRVHVPDRVDLPPEEEARMEALAREVDGVFSAEIFA
jgi:hypothetical protein